MRDVLKITAYAGVFVVGIGLAAGLLNGLGLLALPFVVRQQTAIVRNGNGYVTAQQQLLRQLRTDYDQAGPEQQAGIRRQMAETADLIPGQVQPDIAAFIGR